MRSKMLAILVIVSMLAITLSACGATPEPVVNTVVVPQTVQVKETVIVPQTSVVKETVAGGGSRHPHAAPQPRGDHRRRRAERRDHDLDLLALADL